MCNIYTTAHFDSAEMTTTSTLQRYLAALMIAVSLIVSVLSLLYTREAIPEPLIISHGQLQALMSINDCNTTPLERTAAAPQNASNATEVKSLRIFLERFDGLNAFYANYFARAEREIPNSCPLPDNSICILHHSTAIAHTSNVVFRMVRFISRWRVKRYREGQLLAVLMTEAERGEYGLQQLKIADIRIDHHPSSDVLWSEACDLPVKKWETEPAANASQRNGIALFTSNCAARWRSDYLIELMKHVHIDSYGRCWHNVDVPVSRDGDNTAASFFNLASRYRMVVTFENTIEDDYITEKIGFVYKAGAIPVYWGPPQIYSWVPGNHTFIDASKFKGPEDLAKYLRRVDEEDELFQYHTSNFDIAKTKESICKWCPQISVMCAVCQAAHKKLHVT